MSSVLTCLRSLVGESAEFRGWEVGRGRKWTACPTAHGCSPGGVRSPATTDKLHVQSLPDREVWRVLSATNDVGIATKGNGVLHHKVLHNMTHRSQAGAGEVHESRLLGCPVLQQLSCATGVPRAVLKGKKRKRVRYANRNERSLGRYWLPGRDIGKTKNHTNSIEQGWAVGGGWRLEVGGW